MTLLNYEGFEKYYCKVNAIYINEEEDDGGWSLGYIKKAYLMYVDIVLNFPKKSFTCFLEEEIETYKQAILKEYYQKWTRVYDSDWCEEECINMYEEVSELLVYIANRDFNKQRFPEKFFIMQI